MRSLLLGWWNNVHAFFVLWETARLSSTRGDSRVILSTAPSHWVTRLPWHRKQDQDADERHGAWEDDATRKVPAQRRVARLLARPAPGERHARGGTDTKEHSRVSHVSVRALPAPARAASLRHHAAPLLRALSRYFRCDRPGTITF